MDWVKQLTSMEISNLNLHIEALIFASDRPLSAQEITELINHATEFMDEKLSPEQVREAIEQVRDKYATDAHSFEIRESGGGFQFLTKNEYHPTIAHLNGDKFLKRLSNAALETLAIIAYKQPVTKGEIESIRGVNSDYSIQKLLEKDLVVICGRNEEMAGKPLLYSTSKSFMDYFGINSSEDLPKLREVFTEKMVEPTVIHKPNPGQIEGTEAIAPEEPVLAVSELGELIENEDDFPQPESSSENDSSTE
jgi:segregation and condensation protein B